ncbi:Clp protease N-terminal domain-containing protein [Nakamurella sp. PAMC28650]|uniref:Clp protease N-terminal domain-containing protein n=1 Tax=Nakamurella sp. PAMC28650 TaxID=2762325 RepID=UPI00164D6524|nr:Clp protease N-terminal domain-containing protein [Nakamurella sp. PAMC28650]QNK82855.1 hypothetical protein H7F38_09385 [Nakamurella sp. PAMC28650]
MFERFTDEGRSVIVWAQEEVVSLRHQQIGTEHLLLGVLRSGDPLLQRAIRTAGITLDSVRERVVESVRRSRKGPTGHIPFTPSAKHVLERSLQVPNHLGHTSSRVVRGWLVQAGIQVAPRTTRASRRQLDIDLLRQLYVDREWLAEQIAADQHVTLTLVLRALHEQGIAVRPGGPPPSKVPAVPVDPRLAALSQDEQVTDLLER